MKIKELTNAPQWLIDAVVRDEDVEIDQFGRVVWNRGSWHRGDFRGGNFWGGDFLGGDFRGGNFLGGDFRGGNFLGGDFLGGDFRGGNFWGGDFWGGNFLGGDFRGGNFRGGNFWGGDFWGGDFLGGDFWGGNFWGEKIKLRPISLYGLRWDVVITDARMKIGCQIHRLCEWEAFDDRRIAEMDGKDALRFWRENKDGLLRLARGAGRSFEPVAVAAEAT